LFSKKKKKTDELGSTWKGCEEARNSQQDPVSKSKFVNRKLPVSEDNGQVLFGPEFSEFKILGGGNPGEGAGFGQVAAY
jgi:hypothetical protein